MYKPRFSRSDYRGGSPFRRSFSPELPPFPGDCSEFGRFRHPSPGYGDDFRRYSGPRYDDCYPFSARDCSPPRYGDYGRRYGGYGSRSGDYGSRYRDYAHRYRECSPRRADDYEDFYCRDNEEFGRFSERRSRALSRDRSRFNRSIAVDTLSPGRCAEYSPSRYAEEYRRQCRVRHRSLSPVPYYGYSALDRSPEELQVTVRARSATPSGRRSGIMSRSRMGSEHAAYVSDMTSRYRRDNERRREFSAESDNFRTSRRPVSMNYDGLSVRDDVHSKRRETSLTRQTETVTDDRQMTSDMNPRRVSRFLRWC